MKSLGPMVEGRAENMWAVLNVKVPVPIPGTTVHCPSSSYLFLCRLLLMCRIRSSLWLHSRPNLISRFESVVTLKRAYKIW
jgi:hypothetical protein